MIMENENIKKILIVIDMQNDFVFGSLGTDEAKQIVDLIKDKILTYDKNDVYATRDTHHDNYLETLEGRNLPIKHCIEGTKGHEIVDELKSLILEGNIFNKETFGSIDLSNRIKQIYDENDGNIEIEICGLCTDICVISNALLLKAKMPEVKISLDKNLTEGVNRDLKESAIKTMRSCQVNII